MNCKPGDLAVIVRSNDSRNVGRFVSVLRRFEREKSSWWISCSSVLHGQFSDWPPGAEVGQYDDNLRPIRPNETPEESTEAMRLLTQLPQKEKV